MNKVEKIRAEIERRKEILSNIQTSDSEVANFYDGKAKAYNEVLELIDSIDDKCDGCNNVKGCINCEDGSEWAHYEEPELQFKVGDTIRSKVWESAVHEIVFMNDSAYFLENGRMVRFADQEQWELVEEPVSIDFEQELYKAFGQVKDFTLGMRIAKHFFELGLKTKGE